MMYNIQLSDLWQREAAIRFERSCVNTQYVRPKHRVDQRIVMSGLTIIVERMELHDAFPMRFQSLSLSFIYDLIKPKSVNQDSINHHKEAYII